MGWQNDNLKCIVAAKAGREYCKPLAGSVTRSQEIKIKVQDETSFPVYPEEH